jgi:hypothetical protein
MQLMETRRRTSNNAGQLQQQETTATPIVRIGQKRPQSPQKRKRDAKRDPSMAALRPRLRGEEGHQTGLTKSRPNYILGFDELENEVGGNQQS